MSVRRKQVARALRALLVKPVTFTDEQVDRMIMRWRPGCRGQANDALAAAVRFMGCAESYEEDSTWRPEGGPCRDDVVTWEPVGHSGPGLYIMCGEYPEEGTIPFPMTLGEALRLAREL